MSLPRIAIATGDPAGIGPEIALKAALAPQVRKICRPLLVGDRSALEAHADACGLKPDLRCLTRAADAAWNDGALTLVERKQFKPGELHIGAIAAPHGEAALDSAKTAIDAALAGEVDAVVAAPHTESSIKLAGIEFDGYPTFVARCAGVSPEDAFLMLCFDSGGAEMRIAHVTLHASLRRAIKLLTRDRVLNAIRSARRCYSPRSRPAARSTSPERTAPIRVRSFPRSSGSPVLPRHKDGNQGDDSCAPANEARRAKDRRRGRLGHRDGENRGPRRGGSDIGRRFRRRESLGARDGH